MKPLPDHETLKQEYVNTVFDLMCTNFEEGIESGDHKAVEIEIGAVKNLLSHSGSHGNIYNHTLRLGYDPHELRDYLLARYTKDSNDIDWWVKCNLG